MEPLIYRLPEIVDNTYESDETAELVEKVFSNVLYIDKEGNSIPLTIYFDEYNLLKAMPTPDFQHYFVETSDTPQQTINFYEGH